MAVDPLTGIKVYVTPDTGNGESVNIALVGTPYVVTIGTPLVDGKLSNDSVTVTLPQAPK